MIPGRYENEDEGENGGTLPNLVLVLVLLLVLDNKICRFQFCWSSAPNGC